MSESTRAVGFRVRRDLPLIAGGPMLANCSRSGRAQSVPAKRPGHKCPWPTGGLCSHASLASWSPERLSAGRSWADYCPAGSHVFVGGSAHLHRGHHPRSPWWPNRRLGIFRIQEILMEDLDLNTVGAPHRVTVAGRKQRGALP